MFKKTISLLMITAIAFGATLTVNAQDEAPYAMWEQITITPDNTKLKVLGENMRKHNMKYHKEGPHDASVYNIATGPNIGKMVWMMGPLKFSDIDGRPSKGGHDEDWRDNIMPYVKKMTNGEYWKQDTKLSNVSMLKPGEVEYPLLYIRYHEVAKDHGYSLESLLKQVSETIKAMDGVNPWGVYDNQFRQGYTTGRHLATVSFLKNWAELDDDNKFKDTFLKVHGKNSWSAFIDGMEDSHSNTWDEIWEYNKKLSGK
ncbi:MAG: hypothetical protein L3J34_02715 [Flavobacteriaceae bacterium]|nr:hypothetical protein [Flavobacteriaceae bacterium]